MELHNNVLRYGRKQSGEQQRRKSREKYTYTLAALVKLFQTNAVYPHELFVPSFSSEQTQRGELHGFKNSIRNENPGKRWHKNELIRSQRN